MSQHTETENIRRELSDNDQLAGLEVWSVDGEETPVRLPAIGKLTPYSEGSNA